MMMAENEEEEEDKEKEKNKKKRKFWSKLMGMRRREKRDGDGLMLHSKTMKEKVSTKWVAS